MPSFARLRCLMFWCLLASLPVGAVPPDSLLRLSPARRYVVIKRAYYNRMLRDDTSGALRVRRELVAFFRKNGSDRDRFHLQVGLLEVDLLSHYRLRHIRERATAQLRQAEADGDTMMVAKAHQNLGLYFFSIQKAYYWGFWHYGRAFELIRRRTEADFPEHTYSVYTLGRMNYDFFNYEKAIELGWAIHPTGAGRVTMDHLFNAALIGLSYLHRQRYDSARYYFEWGLGYLDRRELDNDAWIGIFNGNIGRTLAAQGRAQAAVPYLKKGLEYTTRFKVWDNVAPFGTCLARLHLTTQPDSAGHYARLAHRAALREGLPKVLYETHRTLAIYYQRVGSVNLALRHADSAATAKEQWQAEVDVTLKHRAEMALEAERHQAREVAFQREKDRQVLLRNGLLLVVLLAGSVAWLLYARQAMAARHRQQRAQAELQMAQAKLDQYLESFREKNSLIERISGELAAAAEPNARQRNESIATLLGSVILTDADWQRFRFLFEQVHPGFFDDLRQRYPDLTPAEVRLVALSRLGVPTREMASMLGVSVNSVHTGRYRLRRKLEALGADEAVLALIRAV